MRWWVAAALAASMAGCLQAASSPAGGTATQASAVLVDDPATAFLAPSLSVDLAALRPGKMLTWSGVCPCQPFTFGVDVGSGWDGWLDLRVQWNGTQSPGLGASLHGADGRGAIGQRGFDDRVARLWNPSSGKVVAEIEGKGAFWAIARLGTTQQPSSGDLLPNLVELVIEGPHIGTCDAVEQTEQGAKRCLRFGNGVGNPGQGAMQVRLTLAQGANALAERGGHFVQEVRQADGTVRVHDVGPATFHLVHGHWHYAGLARYQLFAVDPSTGLRGAMVSSQGKSGFCFLDWDKMPENTTQPDIKERAETDCLVPGVNLSGHLPAPRSEFPPAWTNGISRGWYDFYESGLSDQYVEVSGLPDGTYELVSTADPLGTLQELDETDNQSSIVLSVHGDQIDVLEERAHYHVQSDDDA